MNEIHDEDQVFDYLEIASLHAERGNAFGHGLFLGRALEYADQNAVDPEWLKEAFANQGLQDDIALISEPKIKANRG